MDDFQSIESGAGILKDNYNQYAPKDPVSVALRRKRKKLAQTKEDKENIINETTSMEDV